VKALLKSEQDLLTMSKTLQEQKSHSHDNTTRTSGLIPSSNVPIASFLLDFGEAATQQRKCKQPIIRQLVSCQKNKKTSNLSSALSYFEDKLKQKLFDMNIIFAKVYKGYNIT
jgi:hypothetical protein